MIKAIFFDVANTILGKEEVYVTIQKVLRGYEINIPLDLIKNHHRLVTDVYTFPDKTTREFYYGFNKDFLQSFGVIPTNEIIEAIINECSKISWSEFNDVKLFKNSKSLPLGVLSNWDNTLPSKLKGLSSLEFKWILGSEKIGVKKPDPLFFESMIKASGVAPDEILFIGDSLKLDIIPALQVGVKPVLIDRDNHYKQFSGNKITSFSELNQILDNNL